MKVEQALTREQIFETFTPTREWIKPREERVRQRLVSANPVEFVVFKDGQGVLRYATPAAYYDGPEFGQVSTAPELSPQVDGNSLLMLLIPEEARARVKALVRVKPGDSDPELGAGEESFIAEEEMEEPTEGLQDRHGLPHAPEGAEPKPGLPS